MKVHCFGQKSLKACFSEENYLFSCSGGFSHVLHLLSIVSPPPWEGHLGIFLRVRRQGGGQGVWLLFFRHLVNFRKSFKHAQGISLFFQFHRDRADA